MKKVLRLLCGLIDFVIVTVLCQAVLIGVFNIPLNAGFAPLLLLIAAYCMYNGLLTRYMGGQTPGKVIGKIAVIDAEAPPEEKRPRPDPHDLLLREGCKALYLVPVIGWIFGSISIIMILIGVKTLHDRVGKTTVIFVGRK